MRRRENIVLWGHCTYSIKNYMPSWMTWSIAKHLRNVTNFNIRQARREFILADLKENKSNAKKFWKVIRGVIPSDKKTTDSSIFIKDQGVQVEKTKVAHFINDYFVNIGKFQSPEDGDGDCEEHPSGPSQTYLDSSPIADQFTLSRVNGVEVFRIIKDINVSKSSGLDNISSFIIKEAFTALIPEVTFMFNLSISTANFPYAWKEALVIPIPKTGNLTQVKNYRPISLLPLPGKVLEKLIHSQISRYLETAALPTRMRRLCLSFPPPPLPTPY